MLIEQTFLFEYVKKGSKVIIYGLGAVGSIYIKQIELTGWCDIIGVCDKRCTTEGYDHMSLEEVGIRNDYDYIIIAIDSMKLVSDVYRDCIKLGIDECKLVNLNMRLGTFPYVPRRELNWSEERLRLALYLTGGIGDFIVSLSFYERIVEICPDIAIDIYVCGERHVANMLYGKKANTHNIYVNCGNGNIHGGYDIRIESELFVRILECNYEKVKKISPQLYDLLSRTQNDIIIKGLVNYGASVHLQVLKKAEILNMDRYDFLGVGDIWKLSPALVDIDLHEEYLGEFRKLGLKCYITVNRGAGKIGNKNLEQTKVWPLSYYNRLVKLLKDRYRDMELVQLGSTSDARIENIDRYILGQPLELVEYILKGASLHIDCEGGLVHMATNLGTKCAVLFGPTPINFYKYEGNINIRAERTCNNCMAFSEEWFCSCLKEQKEPECMYNITPESVFEKLMDYLDKKYKER